jgi:excisionase family DNA binding protein
MQTSTILQNLSADDLKVLISQAFSEQLEKISPPQPAEPGYLSRKEVCKELKITYPTLSYYTKTGIIKGFRLGRRILYRKSDIDDSLKLIREIKYKRGQ